MTDERPAYTIEIEKWNSKNIIILHNLFPRVNIILGAPWVTLPIMMHAMKKLWKFPTIGLLELRCAYYMLNLMYFASVIL